MRRTAQLALGRTRSSRLRGSCREAAAVIIELIE
jgi:hypothetical protein